MQTITENGFDLSGEARTFLKNGFQQAIKSYANRIQVVTCEIHNTEEMEAFAKLVAQAWKEKDKHKARIRAQLAATEVEV
jgi:RNA binding exosome subunit